MGRPPPRSDVADARDAEGCRRLTLQAKASRATD